MHYYNHTSTFTTKANDSFYLVLRKYHSDIHVEVVPFQSALSTSGHHYQFLDCFGSTLLYHVVYDSINEKLKAFSYYFLLHIQHFRLSCDPNIVYDSVNEKLNTSGYYFLRHLQHFRLSCDPNVVYDSINEKLNTSSHCFLCHFQHFCLSCDLKHNKQSCSECKRCAELWTEDSNSFGQSCACVISGRCCNDLVMRLATEEKE
ncbi:hypothetical protein EG327_008115 [Venturia inaequalis]|uniref:Uncharacterized protein n=1 Tax=Venturia inaequalis TaxID=5025 RepID=A0A8H3VRE1_VENIN|nr:hypothetical protein EG327_008115 [Venturia inaequalis]